MDEMHHGRLDLYLVDRTLVEVEEFATILGTMLDSEVLAVTVDEANVRYPSRIVVQKGY